jgi:hypothetical protein
VKPTGRPRLYCSPACRKAAYEDRRAHRDGAVKVQVVEKLITEVRERRIEVPHPRSDCINAVLADDDLMVSVIWTLTALVRDRTARRTIPTSRSSGASNVTPEPCPKRSTAEQAQPRRRPEQLAGLRAPRESCRWSPIRWRQEKYPSSAVLRTTEEGNVQRHEPDFEPQRGQGGEER